MPAAFVRSSLLLSALALSAALGCSKSEGPKLVDYLEEIEFDVPLEKVAYVSLGKFDIPIAATQKPTDASPEIAPDEAFWMRLQFELQAETDPDNEAVVAAEAEAHREPQASLGPSATARHARQRTANAATHAGLRVGHGQGPDPAAVCTL